MATIHHEYFEHGVRPANGTLLNRERASQVLQDERLDGLLATMLENVYYLSNFWCENLLLLPYQTQVYAVLGAAALDRPVVACGINELANGLQSCPPRTEYVPFGRVYRFVNAEAELDAVERGVKDIVIDRLGESRGSAGEALAAALERAGLTRGRVAFDERCLHPEARAEVERRLPDLQLVPGYATFRRIRAVKTPEEQERLRAALRLNERAIEAAMAVAAPGVREHDMIAAYDQTVVAAGGRSLSTGIFFGRRGSSGYTMRRDAVLEPNGVIRFDTILQLQGYCSDIARNFAIGEPADPRVRRYYDAILEAESRAVEAMRPGTPASAVFAAAIAGARAGGIPHYERHHVGHGVGLEVYDAPLLGPNDHTPLEANMVFEVETPYYELGFAGLQVEDTVLVTPGGGEIMGQLDRRFQVVAPSASRA
jgi:Xaa-Pro aminopeptidase